MKKSFVGLLALSWAWASAAGAAEARRPAIEAEYAAAAGRIAGAELVDGKAYEILEHLTERIGPRLSGSPGAEAAVAWTLERLKADGLDARAEKVTVPHWVRGAEEAEIVAPARQKVVVTALGGSDPTPEEGFTAEVVEAGSFEELKALGEAKVRERIVLFMNEENGLRGGKAYAQAHSAELPKHVAALEADSGAARPQGFGVTAGPGALETVGRIAGLLKTLGADTVTAGGGGADIGSMNAASVPRLGLTLDGTHYFDWHHTPADTLDKVKPEELAADAAAMAVMAYVLADLPETLPRPSPEPERP